MSEILRRARSGALTAAFVSLGASTFGGRAAHANPRPLPFTYQSETLPKGAVEVEQFVDLVPVRMQTASSTSQIVIASQYQTEFEVGLTDRLELSLYVTLVPQPNNDFAGTGVPQLPEGNGVKQRLRYRLADPEAWPVDVALYGELSENEREIEIEGKVILQRRVGRVRFITNLWSEYEFYLDGHHEWVLNPTLGVTAELSPRYHLGVESWMRAEDKLDGAGADGWVLHPQVYVGPAFMMNFGKMWWSNGVYVRANDDSNDQAVPYNAYGRFWVRTIVGLSF